MLPPLFPGESHQIELNPITPDVQQDSAHQATEVKRPTRSFSTIHTGFWVATAIGLTMVGFVVFLAVGVLTTDPNSETIASARYGGSDMGSVYGTWTDLPQGKNQPSIFNAAQLENDILKTINNHPGHTFGIVVAPVGAGDQLRINDNQKFIGASTTKILTAIMVLSGVDNGKWDLDHIAYELKPAPTPSPSPAENHNHDRKPSPTPTPSPEPTPQPTPVTIEQAVQKMINRSDNTAWEQLISKVGPKALQQFANGLGMQDYNVYNNQTSAKDLALMLQKLYSGQLLSKSSQELLLSYMQKTNEERMLPEAFTQSGDVYHKYGWLSSVVHDVGIVDNYGKPVIVVLMSDGDSDYKERTAILRKIAEQVERSLVDSR